MNAGSPDGNVMDRKPACLRRDRETFIADIQFVLEMCVVDRPHVDQYQAWIEIDQRVLPIVHRIRFVDTGLSVGLVFVEAVPDQRAPDLRQKLIPRLAQDLLSDNMVYLFLLGGGRLRECDAYLAKNVFQLRFIEIGRASCRERG